MQGCWVGVRRVAFVICTTLTYGCVCLYSQHSSVSTYVLCREHVGIVSKDIQSYISVVPRHGCVFGSYKYGSHVGKDQCGCSSTWC